MKSLSIVSAKSGIPLNDISNDSVALNKEYICEATEVANVDPDLLDEVEGHE